MADLWIRLVTDGWSSVPVKVAFGSRARLRGMLGPTADHGLLLRTRSVHGFGLHDGLEVVVLDSAGAVLGSQHLYPRGILIRREASWMIELPAGHPLPADGVVLEPRILAKCP